MVSTSQSPEWGLFFYDPERGFIVNIETVTDAVDVPEMGGQQEIEATESPVSDVTGQVDVKPSDGQEVDDKAAQWRSHARTWEQRATSAQKELEEARKVIDELNEQVGEREQLAQAKAEAEAALERVRIGVAVGLPPALAERLTGTNAEEIRADAEQLMALMNKPSWMTDVRDLVGGSDPSSPQPIDAADIARRSLQH